jgi:hypothetical protein
MYDKKLRVENKNELLSLINLSQKKKKKIFKIKNDSFKFIAKINQILNQINKQNHHQISNKFFWINKKKGILINSSNIFNLNFYKNFRLTFKITFINLIRLIISMYFNSHLSVVLNTNADTVIFKNNVSLFFYKKKKRIKINHFLKNRSVTSFKKEIEAYKLLKKINKFESRLKIPHVNEFKIFKKFCFLSDEIIFSEKNILSKNNYISLFKELIKLKKKKLCISRLDKIFPNKIFKIRKRLGYQNTLLKKKYIFTYAHGDLSEGNILFNNEKFYIIDWEKSGINFLISDFLKICNKNSYLLDLIINFYNKYYDKKNLATLTDTLKVYNYIKDIIND